MGLTVENLSYTYPGNSTETPALRDISLKLETGEFLLITGPSGSGKTTLIKHFNGSLRPQAGKVSVDGLESGKKVVRKKVGMLFQHSRDQLFSETVYREIAFGPSNFGIKGKELEARVRETLELVRLDPGLLERSPFSLSGGEMRKVALAGVLALRPSYLVLDEPTAGLDPEARESFREDLEIIRKLRVGIVVVTHDLDEFLPLAEKVVLLKEGKLAFAGSPEAYLQAGHSPAPQLTEVLRLLKQKWEKTERKKGNGGGIMEEKGEEKGGEEPSPLREDVYRAEEALEEILKLQTLLEGESCKEKKGDGESPDV